MEVTVAENKEQRGKGRVGTVENPETYENVPGHIIPIIEREFDDFDNEAEQFLSGELEEVQFIGFRLKQGVYGQRQPDVQMIRVKLPFGGVTPEQMEAFASVVEKYAPLNKGHVTTRQNIQIHHVPLRDTELLLREIAEAGLSSREGCGNTIRNVTGDPWAGVAADEVFDPTAYAGAYVRYFVRHPTTQLMPRKIKTSFTGSDADRAISGIHDIAFLARARIKVLIDKIGIDAFREQVDEELEGEWVQEREFGPELVERLRYDDDEQESAPKAPAATASPNGDRSEFDRFVAGNVQPQRQEGFSTVEVKITRGDLSPDQFRGLAAIMREHTGGYARSTVQQNFVLRWVRDEALYGVWQKLTELGLGEAGPREISDVVSCPGTDSCKLGITASMGLNKAIKERVDSMQIEDELTKRIHIKMSGCPNGCSQHHIANIGFYGASLKVGERQMPAYIPHIGGNYEGGEVIFGKRLKSRLPAKRVPEAVERWVRLYESEREPGEEFNAFAERRGAERFEESVKDLTLPADFSLETMQQFIDWNRSSPYKVERGEGECAI